MNKKKKTVLRRILVMIIAIAVVTGFGLSYASDSVMKATSIPEDAITMEAEAAEESGLAEETQELTLPSDDSATQDDAASDDSTEQSDETSDDAAQQSDAADDGADADAQIVLPGSDESAGGTDDAAGAEEDETEDDADAAKMPAQSFTGKANGVTVSVTAEEGTFPAETTMKVTTVNRTDVFEAVQEAVEGEVASLKAVDITFFDQEGNEIQPAKEVHVTFQATGMDAAADHDVIHIDDSGNAEVIDDGAHRRLDAHLELALVDAHLGHLRACGIVAIMGRTRRIAGSRLPSAFYYGASLLVLLRINRDYKDNLRTLVVLYISGVLFGTLAELLF